MPGQLDWRQQKGPCRGLRRLEVAAARILDPPLWLAKGLCLSEHGMADGLRLVPTLRRVPTPVAPPGQRPVDAEAPTYLERLSDHRSKRQDR